MCAFMFAYMWKSENWRNWSSPPMGIGDKCRHLLSHLEDTCVEHVLSKLQVRPASKLRIIVLWRLYRRLRKGNSSDESLTKSRLG